MKKCNLLNRAFAQMRKECLMIEMQQDLNDSHCIWLMLSTNLLLSKALNSTESHMSQGFGHKDSEASCAQETSEICPKKSLFPFRSWKYEMMEHKIWGSSFSSEIPPSSKQNWWKLRWPPFSFLVFFVHTMKSSEAILFLNLTIILMIWSLLSLPLTIYHHRQFHVTF